MKLSKDFLGLMVVTTFGIIVAIAGFFMRNPIMNIWSSLLLVSALIAIGIFVKFEKEN